MPRPHAFLNYTLASRYKLLDKMFVIFITPGSFEFETNVISMNYRQ